MVNLLIPSGEFEEGLRSLLNKTCQENASDTPDFILATYLTDCLKAFNTATRSRHKWYKKND